MTMKNNLQILDYYAKELIDYYIKIKTIKRNLENCELLKVKLKLMMLKNKWISMRSESIYKANLI